MSVRPVVFFQLLPRVRPQLALLAFLSILYFLGWSGYGPSPLVISQTIKVLFERFGLGFVAAVSFVENIIGLNVYFPGSVAILTAMALTTGDPSRALMTFLSIIIPSFISHQLNYLIGRILGHEMRGDTIPNASEGAQPSSARWLWFLSTVWHPHFAAVTSMAAGSQKMRYRVFVSYFAPSFLLWNVFWGFSMYSIGYIVDETGTVFPLFFLYIIAWLVWDLIRATKSETRTRGSEDSQ